MSESDSHYVRGSMPIDNQVKTFKGFIRGSEFMTAFITVVLLMPILVFAAKFPWLPSLVATVVVGLILGKALKLGPTWYTTLFTLALLTLFLCLFVVAVT